MKICPKCGKTFSDSTEVCLCGHEFIKQAPKPKENPKTEYQKKVVEPNNIKQSSTESMPKVNHINSKNFNIPSEYKNGSRVFHYVMCLMFIAGIPCAFIAGFVFSGDEEYNWLIALVLLFSSINLGLLFMAITQHLENQEKNISLLMDIKRGIYQ